MRIKPVLGLIFLLLHAAGASAQSRFSPELAVQAARAQIGVTLAYDPSYQRLDYPGGDVPLAGGVCTDVVIRALRGQGIDLQRLVHEDMRAHFSTYPANWGLKRADRNIDHRRVPNLQRYFQRMGWALPLPKSQTAVAAELQPGDLLSWMLPGNLPHIGMVSDQRTARGQRYLILHNVGAGTREEDVLLAWPLTGHYRIVLPPGR